jgi:hypothetical protein
LEPCTHLIVDNEKPVRTLKVIFAIARGAHVLDVSWVYRSLEAHRWLAEERFESQRFPGAKLARLARQHCDRPLLSKLRIYIGARVQPSALMLQELAFICGASLCRTYAEAEIALAESAADLLDSDAAAKDAQQSGNAMDDGSRAAVPAPLVKPSWLFDSVAAHSVLPIAGYVTAAPHGGDFSQDF